MAKHSRRFVAEREKVERGEYYSLAEALELARQTASANFPESVELHIKLGADPTKGDQSVRGTLVLPHGTGKVPRVAVFAEGDEAQAATEAGADRVGGEDLVQAIDEGWMDFDILVAHPSMMRLVGRLGKKLGPRMPSKKSGNITPEVAAAVADLKGGKVEFRMDRGGVCHVGVGRADFSQEQLLENATALLRAVNGARPATVGGRFIRSISVCSSMGPGIKVAVDDVMARVAA